MPAATLLYLTAPDRPTSLASPFPGDPWVVEQATSADEAHHALALKPVDVLLIDRDVADRLGADGLRQLVGAAAGHNVPVAIVGAPGATPPGVRAVAPNELVVAVERVRIDGKLAELNGLGGKEFVAEMVGLLFEQVPGQLRQMGDGLAASDLKAAQRAAHSLKSSAGNFGARAVQELAFLVEQRAAEGDAGAVATLLPQLVDAFERVRTYLQTKVGGGS